MICTEERGKSSQKQTSMDASPPGSLVKISIGREPELVVGYQSITRGNGKRNSSQNSPFKIKIVVPSPSIYIVLATNQLLDLAVLNACCGIIREKAIRKPRLSMETPTKEKKEEMQTPPFFLYPLNAWNHAENQPPDAATVLWLFFGVGVDVGVW
jgi:hypothetical protein